ncbi:MAG: twin-arginine translocase TatA/TatE family subunit [Deltaproteobacteria bacterium]|nr:twin-arginine translocase TatA/TatE family subunit [Deltaproteobacteria bacterium]MBI4374790.1 twin-arginine translocase TatA/TatE family subunit [Deltaproteobacteria bacterium]
MTKAGIGGLGPWELILIFLVVLIVFGAGKLPSIGSSLGQAIKNFKSSLKGGEPFDKTQGKEKK